MGWKNQKERREYRIENGRKRRRGGKYRIENGRERRRGEDTELRMGGREGGERIRN